MKKVFHFLLILLLTAGLASCAGPAAVTATAIPSPTGTPVSTATRVPPTETPLPPTRTPAPAPALIFESSEFPRLSVSIPVSIASGGESQVVPLGRADTPTRDNLPRHILIKLKDYPGPTLPYQGPSIRVFTVLGLEIGFKHQVANTRKVIAGEPPDSGIYPALPIIFGATRLQIRMKPLAFQNGQGFRYLEYDGTPSLDNLTDQTMNYVYQGLTTDGNHYVSVILPVKMPFLNETIAQLATQAATITTPVPEQLLLLPILQKLQAARDEDFSPPLTTLDEIVASLSLTQP
jgi:hypothetical protein